MSTKDFAETLVDALVLAAIEDFDTGTNHDSKAAVRTAFERAKADVLQLLRVPSPHSEDFPDMRDQFSMAALPEILKGDSISVETAAQISGVTVAEYTWRKHFPKVAAILAYEQADAMMKAREVKP